MNTFRRLVVLDQILLLPEQWKRLQTMSDELRIFDPISAEELLRKLSDEMDASPAPMCWTQVAQQDIAEDELSRRLAGAEAVITCWTGIPDDVLEANPQLCYVGFWTNLAAHRINQELARQRGIHIDYIPDYGTDAVAEITLAGMLAVARKITAQAKDTERGKWAYEYLKTGEHVPGVETIPYRMLRGKLLGLVGFGRIGQRVAELALAFGMRVQYYSRNRYPEWESKGVNYASLPELFDTSDVVSVHLSPYAPERIVSADLIARLKDGAIFVNTSAGSLVDQETLLDHVERGRIFVYLDVYEGLPPRSRLKKISLRDNLFTYRSGWFTREAVIYKGDLLLEKIENYLSGRFGQREAEYQRQEDEFEVPCARVSTDGD